MEILNSILLGASLVLVVGALALDLLVRKAFRFPKSPHHITPETVGVSFEDIRFPTRIGRSLYGWWMPAGGEASASKTPTVILVHGWGRNLSRMIHCIGALHPMGFNLLAFDLRGHGSSDPDAYPNMLKFSEDIRAALDHLQERMGVDTSSVSVLGLSVGGAAAIHAASQDARIQRVVTVGAFAHPIEAMAAEFKKRRIPYIPLVWLVMQYLQVRMNIRFRRIAPVYVIERAEARFFLVHGREDKTVPFDHGLRLEKAAREGAAQLWALPGRGHSDCHEEPGYWRRVEGFLRGPASSLRTSPQ